MALRFLMDVATWMADQLDPESRGFDVSWGTETARFDLNNYEPTLPSIVEETLDALDVDIERFSFVDLGSGKGRVVLLASRRPFRLAVGVEHRRGLHRKAQANLAAFVEHKGPSCPVVLLHGDAAQTRLPDGPLVLFLYNPFPASVIRAVLAGLGDREARIVYVHPVEAEALDDLGWLPIASQLRDEVSRTWRIYGPPATGLTAGIVG